MDLSPRQKEVLDTIDRLTKARGYPPTLREMGKALGIRSTNGVADHLKRLTALGYVARDGMKSRGVRLARAWPEGANDAALLAPDEPIKPTGGAMELIRIPVVHSIPPDGQIAPDAVVDTLTFPRRDFSPGPGLLFALRVRTTDMAAEGILPGDDLLCRVVQGLPAPPRDGALCFVSFVDESCLRRSSLKEDGSAWMSRPPGSKPTHLNPRQIVAVVERLWRMLPPAMASSTARWPPAARALSRTPRTSMVT